MLRKILASFVLFFYAVPMLLGPALPYVITAIVIAFGTGFWFGR